MADQAFTVDLDKPLVFQVGHLGEAYEEWVHQPIVSKETPRFFKNDFMELWNLIKLLAPASHAPALFGGGLLGYVMYDCTHYYLHYGKPLKGVSHQLKVGHLGEDYQDWVHQPIVSKEGPRFFESDFWEFWNLVKLISTTTTAPALFGGGLLGYVIYDVTHYYVHHGQPTSQIPKGLKCISNHSSSKTKILQRLHTPKSPTYISLLGNSTQNPRWFNSTSQRPFLIVTPYKESEIRPVILCSKIFGHQIRVNSGGHDYEGLSFRSETPFIMIHLSNLNRTVIDLEEEVAWIQTGVKLGQLYYEIAKKSKIHAFPGGLYPTVGSGGHISGGGIGTLIRKYGLAADNVINARIMDVNGTILERESMGEDLFWAIRGGGGASFCVILAWKLRLVRVPDNVTAFTIREKLNPRNLHLLQKWQNKAHNVSKDLFIRILVNSGPKNSFGNEKFVQVSYNGLFLGPAVELVSYLNKTFPEFDLKTEDCFTPPVGNISCPDRPCIRKECFQVPWIKSVLYFAAKKLDDPLEILLQKKINTYNYYKATSDFLTAPIPDRGWKMIRKMLLLDDRPIIILDPFGGRMDEISEDETPFPHRKGNLYNIQYLTNWGVNSENEANKHIKWIRNLYEKMKPYVAQCPRTGYINYKDLDLGKNDKNCSFNQGKIWGEKYFKGNFERLARPELMIQTELLAFQQD
ncbi:hypothetical protein DH2020_042439 [Rehmannia glutinosa]|uniref:FAD-binding PCMH-type domain-containing protein n=1 Tax=Rehmannia glutinosa TaxID=99300 RepID=A0ABR0UN28_REHGL